MAYYLLPNHEDDFKKVNNYRLNQERLRNKSILKGVNLVAPETTFLSDDTIFGRNVVVEPYLNPLQMSGMKKSAWKRLEMFS